eukprot:TRINITY_DN19_c0_g1_i1.p1 TRINITY_DN19_c0_g1~~TRINITY_DN19_c0_g1_i1.p1  ORF type:complete len:1132 (+),score=130.20 TRINITY_DN19_c0_g1_i1:39-3434(+)
MLPSSVLVLAMACAARAHITTVCTSTAPSQCANKRMVFFLGTYHTGLSASVPGKLHIAKPDGTSQSFNFGSVCSAASTVTGPCPSEDIQSNCPSNIVPSDAVVTCYRADAQNVAMAEQDTCQTFPKTSGSYSFNKAHAYAVVDNAVSGTYTLSTSGTDMNFSPCAGVSNGYPCKMSSTSSFSFELSVAGCGRKCAAAPVVPNSVSSSLATCSDAFDGAICPVQCLPGYFKHGGALICDDGTWSDVTCSLPSTVTETATTVTVTTLSSTTRTTTSATTFTFTSSTTDTTSSTSITSSTTASTSSSTSTSTTTTSESITSTTTTTTSVSTTATSTSTSSSTTTSSSSSSTTSSSSTSNTSTTSSTSATSSTSSTTFTTTSSTTSASSTSNSSTTSSTSATSSTSSTTFTTTSSTSTATSTSSTTNTTHTVSTTSSTTTSTTPSSTHTSSTSSSSSSSSTTTDSATTVTTTSTAGQCLSAADLNIALQASFQTMHHVHSTDHHAHSSHDVLCVLQFLVLLWILALLSWERIQRITACPARLRRDESLPSHHAQEKQIGSYPSFTTLPLTAIARNISHCPPSYLPLSPPSSHSEDSPTPPRMGSPAPPTPFSGLPARMSPTLPPGLPRRFSSSSHSEDAPTPPRMGSPSPPTPLSGMPARLSLTIPPGLPRRTSSRASSKGSTFSLAVSGIETISSVSDLPSLPSMPSSPPPPLPIILPIPPEGKDLDDDELVAAPSPSHSTITEMEAQALGEEAYWADAPSPTHSTITEMEAQALGEEAYWADAPSPSHSTMTEIVVPESDTETSSTSTQLRDLSPRSMIEDFAMTEDEDQTCRVEVQAHDIPAILVISTINGEAQTSEVSLVDAGVDADSTADVATTESEVQACSIVTEQEVQACSIITDGETQTETLTSFEKSETDAADGATQTETMPSLSKSDRDSVLEVLNNGNIMLEFQDDAIEAKLTPEATKHLSMRARHFNSEVKLTDNPDACFKDVKAASAVLADIVRVAEAFKGTLTVCNHQTYEPAKKCDPARHQSWLDALACNRLNLVESEMLRARQSPQTWIEKIPSVISSGSQNLVDWKFRVVGDGVDQVLSWHQVFGLSHKKKAAQSTRGPGAHETPAKRPGSLRPSGAT